MPRWRAQEVSNFNARGLRQPEGRITAHANELRRHAERTVEHLDEVRMEYEDGFAERDDVWRNQLLELLLASTEASVRSARALIVEMGYPRVVDAWDRRDENGREVTRCPTQD